MSAFFITSSGTGIGKTFVTETLCQQLTKQSRPVDALKPVISGYAASTADESDTHRLLKALGREITKQSIAALSPWRFIAPLSPDMAAAQEGGSIDFNQLVDCCKNRIASTEGTLLIEGVGGVMVPLDAQHTVLDWMAALKIPTMLVVGSYLGSLSHTLTSAEVVRGKNIPLAGIIVSESDETTVPLEETVATLKRFVGTVPILPIPRLHSGEDTPDLTGLID
jgi:dethiobiotin synthetase